MELQNTYRYALEILFPSKAINLVREQDGYATFFNMLFINTQGFPIEKKRINVIAEESNIYI